MVEIERKFLIEIPWNAIPDDSFNQVAIEQNYVMATPNSEVRIRREQSEFSEPKFTLTLKHGSSLRRSELEMPISEEDFNELNANCKLPIFKIRDSVAYYGHTIFVDYFLNAGIEGIIVAEVEFKSEDEAMMFEPPSWFGREVTGDGSYSNKMLWKKINQID